MNRLQRYRDLMRTLDPSADPHAAVQLGWGVERPASATAETIARRLELEPRSSHLIVGGIGSGTTTELWRIHDQLPKIGAETRDVSFYIDVAAMTGLDELMRGTLVGLAGLGVVPSMQALQHATAGDATHCILLLDSLDRVMDSKRLESSLRADIPVLQRAGIGVVVVGPMRLLYEPHPMLLDLFDQNVYPLTDVEPEGAGLDFLVEVLSRRVSPEIMPRDSCIAIAKASGGILRDLIALAKGSVHEAYSVGSDAVSTVHIARAADRWLS